MALPDDLIALLAGRTGHFCMESGYHSERWFELDRVLVQRERLRPFVAALAQRIAAHRIDAVCGPMTGGAELAQRIAAEIGADYFFTERFAPPPTAEAGLFPVRYTLPANQRERVRDRRVAIVDDAISAGSAVRGTHADLLACGAKPVVMGALFVFGGAAAKFAAEHGLALEGIAPMTFGIWNAERVSALPRRLGVGKRFRRAYFAGAARFAAASALRNPPPIPPGRRPGVR
jgi:orotate phosphoribosyltransferase